jgi:hypothetical protein
LNAETALEKQIQNLELMLEGKQSELDAIKEELERTRGALSVLTGTPMPLKGGKRFSNFKERPIEAISILLSEAGGSMEQEELTRTLIGEGVFDGKSAPEKRALLSYKINVKNGRLKKVGKKIILLRDSRTSPHPTK